MMLAKNLVMALVLCCHAYGATVIYNADSTLQLSPSPSPSPSPQPILKSDIPIECFLSAQELGLNYFKSILLCTNSESLDPVNCFKEISEPITNNQKVNLCQGATSNGPARCFEESFDLILTVDQRTKLCNGASLTSKSSGNQILALTGPVQCFRRSSQFLLPLTQDEKVILCSNADSDDPVQCFIKAFDLGLTADQRVRLCTRLTPSSW